MTDIIVIAVIVLLLGFSISYIAKKKKSGAACIGCPEAGHCTKCRQDNLCK